MKKIIIALALVMAVVVACSDDDEVRVMPEFNYADTDVQLDRAAGSQHTALILTTVGDVAADYNCQWLNVDVNRRRAIYTATEDNTTGQPRTATVSLRSGEYTATVTVTQKAN